MEYIAVGIMSGTSLDGLDVALCKFVRKPGGQGDNTWDYHILAAHTFPYPPQLAAELRGAQKKDALSLVALHKQYARFIAGRVNDFLRDKPAPLLIASHGHTVFHYPDAGINFQLGDGAVIASLTGLPVVCDFRSQDIALGGQGAPLVPVGDYYLFGEYDLLLNLGGFSNITVRRLMKAFDICPVNFALNYFARRLGMDYDRDGQAGRQGKVHAPLLEHLDSLEYYAMQEPKSLSDHWFYDEFLRVVEAYKIDVTDKLRTVYEHIARQIAAVLNKYNGRVLVTGGGARNKFLIELLRSKTVSEIVVPELEIIDFKEALIFAFLGLLRYLDQTNVLASVTGAKRNSISGALYLP